MQLPTMWDLEGVAILALFSCPIGGGSPGLEGRNTETLDYA